MTVTRSVRKPTNQHETQIHQTTLKAFLLSVNHLEMLGIIERAMIVFSRGQGVYNAMHFADYEPIYEQDVSFIFNLLREEFLKPTPKLEEGEPDVLGGIGANASAVWMRWYRDKHGVSLSESRDAGIRRREELHGAYSK